MCNDYSNRIAWAALVEGFSERNIRIFPPGGNIPNLEPKDDIWPTDPAPAVVAAAGGAALVPMRFGFPPPRPKAGPVINWRAEGRRFPTHRCLIPADGFYEFTGEHRRKAKWCFTRADAPWFCIAGIWRPPEGSDGQPRFAMLTVEPGADIAPYHPRQIVVIEAVDWATWLASSEPVEHLLRPSPADSLVVEQVRRPRTDRAS